MKYKKKTLPFIIFSCCKRRDFLCNHSNGDLFTVIIKWEDIIFSREMYYNNINFPTTFPHPLVVLPGIKLIEGALPHFCNSFIFGE